MVFAPILSENSIDLLVCSSPGKPASRNIIGTSFSALSIKPCLNSQDKVDKHVLMLLPLA